MLDSKATSAAPAEGSAGGTGSRSFSRTSPIASTARAYASSIPPSSTKAFCDHGDLVALVIEGDSGSLIINAMSGSPIGSGFGSGRGSTVRTRS
jgi:hypothetical protein